MVSLQNFSNISSPGEVPICEKNGRICSLPSNEIDKSKCITSPMLSTYPDINISRELFHSVSSTIRDDRSLMIPVYEPLLKKITRTFVEEGFVEALNVATAKADNSGTSKVISSFAKYLLYVINTGRKVKIFFRPYLKEQGIQSIAKFSQTRDWMRSSIRCIKWHPNCFKIAVAASDDSIRIYTDEASIIPILKSGLQKCITSMAWRPFTGGELAVGCQNGVLIWSMDPNSLITRPSSQTTHLKYENHFPVLSVEWNSIGSLLASSSINSPDILIWDVDQNRNMPLKRVGSPCSLLLWSPDDSRLCSTTINNVFRVWDTNKWLPDRWTILNGTVQSLAWSPCSSYLLFVTTNEPYLYSLRFFDERLFTSSLLPKQALPIADLSKINNGRLEIGGHPQFLAWCPFGKYLAITYKETTSITLFTTTIQRNTLNIIPNCVINGYGIEYPTYICFKNIYKNNPENVLTIGWSSGRVQYFPFI